MESRESRGISESVERGRARVFLGANRGLRQFHERAKPPIGRIPKRDHAFCRQGAAETCIRQPALCHRKGAAVFLENSCAQKPEALPQPAREGLENGRDSEVCGFWLVTSRTKREDEICDQALYDHLFAINGISRVQEPQTSQSLPKSVRPLLTCAACRPIPHAKKGPRFNRGPFGFIEQCARDYALSASNCFMKATSASTPSRGMAL